MCTSKTSAGKVISSVVGVNGEYLQVYRCQVFDTYEIFVFDIPVRSSESE